MIRFDDTLRVAQDTLKERFGALPEGHVVRDAAGLVTVVLPDDVLPGESDWRELAKKLSDRLGAFSPGDRRVLVRRSDLVDPENVLESQDAVRLEEGLQLVDRLLTNQDWLREPLPDRILTRTVTAFSVKGGVGRTTALAVLAWYLSRRGERVVVVDLDLEGPGIGPSMLSELPRYGVIDWLIESLVGQASPDLLSDCLQRSPLADETDGEIFVLPAFGSSTHEYIAKLGRVYMPTTTDDFQVIGLAERLRDLLKQLAGLDTKLQTCLLDSRAGLHDIGSAAVTRLGAEVLMFARGDDQTWQAYRRLFRHLRNARSIAPGGGKDDLRWRLKMVAAQTDPEQIAQERWIEQCYEVWTDELYDEETTAGDVNAFTFARDDQAAPHYPLFIDFDYRVRGYDLLIKENWPRWEVVESTFGNFLRGVVERLPTDSETS